MTGPERVRFQKFSFEMDDETTEAMKNLFEYTKEGCNPFAYELFESVHFGTMLSDGAIVAFEPMGLCAKNGYISSRIEDAIKKAVALNYLVMRDPVHLVLKPEPVIH